MNGPKLFILALVLLAILFAVAMGVGIGREDQPSGEMPGWLSAARDLLLDDEATKLRLGDVRSLPDRRPITSRTIMVPPGATNQLLIIESDQRIRSLKLTLAGWRLNNAPFPAPRDAKITLDWTPAGEGAELQVPLYSSKTVTLQVLKEGGTLTLTNEEVPVALIEIE